MKIKYLGIFVLVFYAFISKADPADTSCYKIISSDDFYLIKETQDIYIIDVRSFKDYKKGRIPNAYSAEDKEQVSLFLEGIDKHENLYVYCYMGVKSKAICKYICKDLGFKNVNSIEGGMGQWKKKGFSVDKGRISKRKK